MEMKLDHIAKDGRPVYVVNQPSAEVCAKVLKKLIDKKLLEKAKEEAGVKQ